MRRVGAALLGLAALLLALDWWFPPDLSRLAATGTVFVDRAGRVVSVRPAPGGVWRLRTGVEDVSPAFLATLIRTEDRHFWRHPGVDPVALARAAMQDLRAGRVVSGGSTLTMQAARLLRPRPRTVASKVIEIARAVQLEWRFSKPEILSIWLTLAPYGGNLEGVRAGALAWYGVPARRLDAAQSAVLVAIPRRPEGLRPDRHAARAQALASRILGEAPGAMPGARLAMPRLAGAALDGVAGGAMVVTTLDQTLQAASERLADAALRGLPERASLAVILADLASRDILAITSGGSDPGEARAAALDLTRAVRSPGSALKPFIYALAMQDGYAGPETRLEDLPRRFGTYAPEDFDRGFAGSVTAGEALRRSLNLPAVALLERVGPQRFAAALAGAGVVLRLPSGAASLPIALGGAGISLRDLAGLYAALGTDGAAAALHLLPQPVARRPFLTGHVAGAIAAAITQPIPDGGVAGIAWKTGTSWGGRDAWAIGFDRVHLVAVWIGRPDGTPLPGATGRGLAVPVMANGFALLEAAPREVVARPRAVPAAGTADALRVLFPPPDAVLTARGSVTLRAMGGRRPLTFLVDGAEVAGNPARREVAWQPSGPGFYRITVLDAAGGAASAAVQVTPP